MTYLLATAIGVLVAFVLSLPAIVLEIAQRGKTDNLPLLVDVKTIFGRKLGRNEVFWAAILFYLVIGALYGAVYVLFVEFGWLFITQNPFSFLSLLIFAVGSWLVLGAVLMPLLRMGWFGAKEGAFVWLELLVGMLLLGGGVWLCVTYFQPVYF